jgi:hypothetical protein
MNDRIQQNNYKRRRIVLMLLLMALISKPGLSNPSMPPAHSLVFVVGDYLQAEGGNWDSEQSPLRSPFGIDFDAPGAMYVVELTRGCLHWIQPSGE